MKYISILYNKVDIANTVILQIPRFQSRSRQIHFEEITNIYTFVETFKTNVVGESSTTILFLLVNKQKWQNLPTRSFHVNIKISFIPILSIFGFFLYIYIFYLPARFTKLVNFGYDKLILSI